MGHSLHHVLRRYPIALYLITCVVFDGFYGIFATLRGTPRSQPTQEARMITIDAPLYPLLLVEKPTDTESSDNTKSDEISDSKSKEEMYSWSSYVRNNFVVSNKAAKKKGDLWKKLEQYRKVKHNYFINVININWIL